MSFDRRMRCDVMTCDVPAFDNVRAKIRARPARKLITPTGSTTGWIYSTHLICKTSRRPDVIGRLDLIPTGARGLIPGFKGIFLPLCF